MKYLDDMLSKYGFDDGSAVPEEAYECRKVYVKALNRALIKFDSNYRVFEWDRPGLHNWLLMGFYDRKWLGARPESLIKYAVDISQESDEGLQKALKLCHSLNLDNAVKVRAFVDNSVLGNILSQIDDEKIDKNVEG